MWYNNNNNTSLNDLNKFIEANEIVKKHIIKTPLIKLDGNIDNEIYYINHL